MCERIKAVSFTLLNVAYLNASVPAVEGLLQMTQFSYAIVLYAYNQEDCIQNAVRAILAQECQPIDILFSDDCSQDATFDILRDEAAAYDGPHRIQLNRNPQNLGVIKHVHRVFALTNADVIINCAGDDLCHPQRARRIIETFEREQPLLACSHAKVEYADGSPAPRVYAKALFYHRLDALNASTSMQLYLGATAAWHRDIFDTYGPICFKECFEDLVFGFRAALEGRVAVIEEDLMTYRLGRGITNSELARETRSDVQARREKELRRDIAVLSQREIDAQTYGLTSGDPVIRRISKALRMRCLRLAYITKGSAPLLKAGLRHPVQTIGAVLSENGRWRRALSKK